jgi:death-on-curing protein
MATFGGKDLYLDVFSKEAALVQALIGNHPFLDGNKRTGIAAEGLVLPRSGWRLTASNAGLETFSLQVAETVPKVAEIATWLEARAQREVGG